MLTRTVSGIIAGLMLVSIILFLPDYATTIAVAVVSAIAFFEFCRAIFGKTNLKNKIPLVIAGYILGFSFMFVPEGKILPVAAIGVVALLVMQVLFYKKITFKDCAACYAGSVYVFALLRHVSMVRCIEDFGKFLVFAIFIGAFVTDTGAYFTGCLFGKHKLAPNLSPKKTIEGSVGGVLATVIVFVLFAFLGKSIYGYGIRLENAVITGVILSVVSQFGDLTASAIKREVGIKDYGNIMPGHGGALDRFDSVIFVAPVFWYINSILPIFVIK